MRCLEYCGRQGQALRDQRDDGIGLLPVEEDDVGNIGNFKSPIQLDNQTDTDGYTT